MPPTSLLTCKPHSAADTFASEDLHRKEVSQLAEDRAAAQWLPDTIWWNNHQVAAWLCSQLNSGLHLSNEEAISHIKGHWTLEMGLFLIKVVFHIKRTWYFENSVLKRSLILLISAYYWLYVEINVVYMQLQLFSPAFFVLFTKVKMQLPGNLNLHMWLTLLYF